MTATSCRHCLCVCTVSAALAAPLPAAPTAEAPFVVTESGLPKATVVISSRPSAVQRFAAAELVEHVRRITGASLPVVTDAAPVSGPRILVGGSRATGALGLRPADFAPQEYRVWVQPQTLVLLGCEADIAEAADPSTPTREPGHFGAAARFDGRRSIVRVPDCGLRDEAGTLEAWIWFPAALPEKHGTILRLDGTGPWTYHILQRDAGSSRVSYTTYDGAAGHGIRSTADLAEGWHHVAGVYDLASGRMELRIDGQSQGTTEYKRTTCRGAVLGIGGVAVGSGADVGNPFGGLIDEVRVSTVARPAGPAAAAPFQAEAETVLLCHFDETDGPPLDAARGVSLTSPPGFFGENATLYAVYDFLERACGVRWYAPGEIGLVCPSTPSLSVPTMDVRRTPAMEHRWITPTALYLPAPPTAVPGRDVEAWKLRRRIGGRAFWVCHSFEGYYDRFLKDHPDWFAQGYPGRPPQMCYSNPDLVRQVAQDARDFFDDKGAPSGAAAMGNVFGIVPMDNNSWCKCPTCQASLNAAEAGNQQFNNGKASEHVFGFANAVATEVRKTHPDKWIGALAYSDYAYHPTSVKLEPNIVVQLCLHTRNWWCPSMEANDRKVLDDWRRLEPERPLYLWLYYCFPALNSQSGDYPYFPGFFARTVVRQMDLYRKAGIRGIFMEHSSEFGQTFIMDQLEFHITLALADSPDLDGETLIAEFFDRYYGAAGPAMRRFYEAVESTYSEPRSYPPEIQASPAHQHQTEELAWKWLGTEERMTRFAALMAEARTAAKTPTEAERVAAFEKGIWSVMQTGRQRYAEHAAARAQPPPNVRVPHLPAAADPAALDWARAATLGPWSSLAGDVTDRRVTARLAHDGTNLCIQLTEELDPAALVDGRNVWDGDDWEVFVAAQRAKPYRQLCIGPTGRSVALARAEGEDAWESGVVVRSSTAGGRWSVAIVLPLDKLLPGGVKPGGTVYLGLYRASSGASRLLAWSPTFAGGFHELGRLGQLTLE